MTANKKKSKRIFYFDALRATAILCVIIIHTTGFMDNIFTFTPEIFYTKMGFWDLFAHNTFRIGVDLFLMLSGALSLGRDWKIRDFLGKRIPRIVEPYVFWAIVCSLILITLTFLFPQIKFIKDFSVMGILTIIYKAFLFSAPSFKAYWFFWMILGTYLIMPIFNKWLYNADLKEAEYFLAIWIVSTIFEYTLMTECPVKLSYFTSPIGIVVLGYYLRHTKRKIFNNKYLALLMIIIPAVIMVVYSYSMLDTTMFFKFNRYSILMIIEVTGVFCLFKCSSLLKNPNRYFKKFITAVAACSYGMYLTHCMFIYALGKLLPRGVLGHFATYTFLLLSAFFGSLALIYILGKIPVVSDFVGIK